MYCPEGARETGALLGDRAERFFLGELAINIRGPGNCLVEKRMQKMGLVKSGGGDTGVIKEQAEKCLSEGKWVKAVEMLVLAGEEERAAGAAWEKCLR
jgi:hypothetical protein